MSMGSDTSGMAGMTGEEGATVGVPLAGSGGGGGGGLSGLLGSMGGLLGGMEKDPATYKELAAIVGKLATTMEAGNKLTPQARQMIQQAVSQGRQQRREEMNPYVGDMLNYITPDMARAVLGNVGVPMSRMRF